MSGKILARAAIILLALIMAACGGDENSSALAGPANSGGSGSGDGSGSDQTASTTAASIQLLSNTTQIGTAGNNSATVTAIVKNSGGVVLTDTPIEFSSPTATLNIQSNFTDDNGRATVEVSAQGSPENRQLTITATSGSATASINISVAGTEITLSGPSSVPLNQDTVFTAKLTDSDNNPISGQSVTISSNANNSVTPASSQTDSSGSVNFTYNASSAGSDTLTVGAYSGASRVTASVEISISGEDFEFVTPTSGQEILLNTPQTIEVTWSINGSPVADGSEVQFSATRGQLTPADGIATTTGGTASVQIQSNNAGLSSIAALTENGPTIQTDVEFVASTVDSINLQANKTQISPNQSTEITATVRDPNNNLVKNAAINFTLNDITGGQLSSSTATTNSQGQAQITYSSGSTTSAKDGITVTASHSSGASDALTLTVAGEALRINLGTGNKISAPSTTTYTKPWTVIVTDANGNAASNQLVELSVTPISYTKGIYRAPDTDAGEPDSRWIFEPSTSCPSEDVNNNGTLDAGEDANGNGSLEPFPSAATPTTVTTSSSGIADFDLTFLQSECSWVTVELSAVTRVGGTESDATQRFSLPCLASDLAYNESNPVSPSPGEVSPYGSSASCSDSN
ncbi:Ig-like domain-containing protein [Marinobacter sp. CHS3-4]|uniref:Ig-like domain-containing protein n=1 Tax=Marinobacter sp. CHS3-4 TaxID=3045174 RepID=UPI0024B5E3CF|nr:Ig-like domain-containing protein [Marinobacter sp. CHS3-4]MDI9246737.1 Ig-like domain-containing protein [Marinobacter sp. CHS3-4]